LLSFYLISIGGGMMIGGILYLHRISNNRVSGSALRNFRFLDMWLGCCGLFGHSGGSRFEDGYFWDIEHKF
jgi:hypothetical protein